MVGHFAHSWAKWPTALPARGRNGPRHCQLVGEMAQNGRNGPSNQNRSLLFVPPVVFPPPREPQTVEIQINRRSAICSHFLSKWMNCSVESLNDHLYVYEKYDGGRKPIWDSTTIRSIFLWHFETHDCQLPENLTARISRSGSCYDH